MTKNDSSQQAAVQTRAVPNATSTALVEEGRERSAPPRGRFSTNAATPSSDGPAGRAAGTSTRPAAPSEHAEPAPTDDEIRCRAYEIYRARCDSGDAGDEVSDWIAAECELRAGGDDAQPSAASIAE